jgi:hypothetical protein
MWRSVMKVRIDWDEWYPVFTLTTYEGRKEVEVDAKTLARWKRAEDAFNKAQDEMRALTDYDERFR